MNRYIYIFFFAVSFYLSFTSSIIGQDFDNQINNNEGPLFDFGLIADIQYADAPTAGLRNYRGSLEKLKTGVEFINEKEPEFVITLGDNIDRDYVSFDKVLPLLSQIQAPVYNVMGNHDFNVDDQYKSLIRRRLNNPKGYFSFSRANYKFILLDGSDWSVLAYPVGSKEHKKGMKQLEHLKNTKANNAYNWNGGIGKVQLEWLEDQLKEADARNETALLFCHWPLWPENGTQLWNNQEVMDLLARHPSVLAWICGHHHAGGYHIRQGIHYLNLKGQVESKSDKSLAILDVYKDRIVVNGYGDQNDEVLKKLPPEEGDILTSDPYHTFRSGLINSYHQFVNEKKGRVAFLGGSITHNPGWRDSIMQYLEVKFPETNFEFIPAGIPSMGSTPAAFRLERDVLMDGPVDLLFEEAAVNDDTNGRSDKEQLRGMEGIIRHVLLSNPETDIVLMYFVDPDKMESYRAGQIPQVIKNHEKVAVHYNISSINLAREVTDRIDSGEFNWKDDFKNLHPSPFGQGIYARSIIDFLESAWKDMDMKNLTVTNHAVPEELDLFSYDEGKLIEVSPDMNTEGWRYNPIWEPDDGKGTRSNYTSVPMITSNRVGPILKFEFTGKAVGIAVAAGPDAGLLEYRIDGGTWMKQDLFTRWSSALHLPWYYTLASELERGHHQLEIRLTDEHHPESDGHACRIRYFFINQ